VAGWAGTSLSRRQWAELIAGEAHELGYSMTPRQLAEALGVREAEGFTAEGEYIGPWEEEASFGSTKERLDYKTSTRAALKRWAKDGKSWWPGWGDWEKGEAEGEGPTRYKRHLALATTVLARGSAGRARVASRSSTVSSPGSGATEAGSTAPSGIKGDVLHFGLVAALVTGGVALMGLGTTRFFHAGRTV
jgi:hypothetical protein